MILSMIFLFLMLLLITVILFYLFCFFLPALKLKYDGISSQLATEMRFAYNDDEKRPKPDFTKTAFISSDSVGSEIQKRMNYIGKKNCWLFHESYMSEYKNPKICIGFADCVRVCPQEAIKIIDGRALVGENCNGCGKCVDYCPEKLISLIDSEDKKNDANAKKDASKDFKFWKICYKIMSVGMRGQ